jgi:uncharacterized protein (DUF924 family)
MISPSDILRFWFSETDKKHWFNATDAFDAEIRNRFEVSAMAAASSLLDTTPHGWEASIESSLALILMLDQFPRNMYRGTPGAFAWDSLAVAVAGRMVDKSWDLKTAQERRAFIYMPFMHSEDLAVQDKCVALCDARLEDESTLFHAKAHRKLILEFGRFPHRNKVLGRDSTPAEKAFLDAGGYSP